MTIFGFLLLFIRLVECRFASLDALRPQVSVSVQESSVQQLLERTIPEHSNQFIIKVKPVSESLPGYVTIDSTSSDKIKVTGNSGVDAAFGIQVYLRHCCNAHFSWDGNTLNLPAKLPSLKRRKIIQSIGQFRFFSNVCTFSYSFVWWQWSDWEKFIDWLALNGFNLPLANVGQEIIWTRLWMKLGLTEQEINEHFTGPAFLAWNRMGNLRKWGGPLPQSWMHEQMHLQKLIVNRMVSLGMVPVLPAFPGHVPRGLKKHYPQANISQVHCWSHFNHTYTCMDFLQPSDPLFQQIGNIYMTEMEREYGLYHAYSADSFNEMAPSSYDHQYLHDVATSIYNAMAQTDPQAVWIMQGWLFLVTEWQHNDNAKALLTALEPGKMIILDLYSEAVPIYNKLESYYGQPYIWNMLHNFGGANEMHGSASSVNKGLTKALQFVNSTLVGTGLTMEGIFQNYVIYQFMIDRSWRRKELNKTEWIKNFASQRYGRVDKSLQEAWLLIWATVYDGSPMSFESGADSGSFGIHESGHSLKLTLYHAWKNLLFERPTLSKTPKVPYNASGLCRALKVFIERSPKYKQNHLFRLDLVDFTREMFQVIGSTHYYPNLVSSFEAKDLNALRSNGTALVELLDDLDLALSTESHFMLGKWTGAAKAKGDNKTAALMEYNARNQITLWGPNGEILDYARKQWSGLVKEYHLPRWQLFVSALEDALRQGKPFNRKHFSRQCLHKIEQPFTFKQETLPVTPTQDAIAVCIRMYNKYSSLCKDYALSE